MVRVSAHTGRSSRRGPVFHHVGYKDKGSADANADKASAVFGKMASLMTSAPVVREGEIVWAFDGD